MGTLKPQRNGPHRNTVIGNVWVDSEEGREWGAAKSSAIFAVPNVAVHPSTASVPTSHYSMWHYNYLHVSIKGSMKNSYVT